MILPILSDLSCTRIRTSDNVNFSLIDSTDLIINTTNNTDTVIANLFSVSYFLYSSEQKQIVLPMNGSSQVTLSISEPHLVWYFFRHKPYFIFVLPRDHLEVSFDYDYTVDYFDAIQFKSGKSVTINEYFKEKQRCFGFLPSANFNMPSLPFIETLIKYDSLCSAQLDFIDEYCMKNDLPEWFINTEKYDLYYGNASAKIASLSYREQFLKQQLRLSEDIFSFLESIEINTPDANLSIGYFNFLSSYFMMKVDTNLEGKTGFDRAFPIFTRSLPVASSELQNDLFVKFVIAQLSQLSYYADQKYQLSQIDSLLNQFSNIEIIQDHVNYIIRQNDKKLTEIETINLLHQGEKAPYFYLSNENGDFFSLNDFKGQYIYLTFWATWCKPCIDNIPSKNKLVQSLQGKPVVLINICLDEDLELWQNIIKESPLKGVNLICRGNWTDILRDAYFIQSVPHYTLIDNEGFVIENNCNGPDIILDKLLDLH